MTLTITRADTADWERARAVRLRSLREEPSAYGSTYDRELSLREQDWQERLATAYTWLALDEAEAVVGTVTGLWVRNGDMALVAMYVAPEARGTGCAEALIEAVVDTTRWRGGTRVVLEVTEGNDRAVRCYARFGFSPTGRRRPSGRDPELTEIQYTFVTADDAGSGSSRYVGAPG